MNNFQFTVLLCLSLLLLGEWFENIGQMGWSITCAFAWGGTIVLYVSFKAVEWKHRG